MNELQELQQLLQELLQGIQETLQSGEILSDEFQGMLAQTLNTLTDKIDQTTAIQQKEPVERLPPTQPSSQETEASPFPSSNINAFKYDPKTQQLVVKFQDKYPAQNGPIYSYQGVPDYIFDIFRRGAVGPKTSGSNRWHTWKRGITPSHGAAMYALIKAGGFPYSRIK